MEEKIGINIKEASEIMGISKQLMTESTKLQDFPCLKFPPPIVINKPMMIAWFNKNSIIVVSFPSCRIIPRRQ